ncbi:glycosyltransferase, partial [Mycobacterium tuberculosis]|nr:glycosyltransferase [Mycobacterium tuberculosis]
MATEFGKRAIILPNPYDEAVFRRADPAANNDILFVGRLAAVKGVDVLLRAFDLIRGQVPEIRLTIVGAGPERVALERITAELRLGARVTFAGPLQGEALA